MVYTTDHSFYVEVPPGGVQVNNLLRVDFCDGTIPRDVPGWRVKTLDPARQHLELEFVPCNALPPVGNLWVWGIHVLDYALGA